jgi:hypothetical protein
MCYCGAVFRCNSRRLLSFASVILSQAIVLRSYGSECFHLTLLRTDVHVVRCTIISHDASGLFAPHVGPLIYYLYLHLDKVLVENSFIGRHDAIKEV